MNEGMLAWGSQHPFSVSSRAPPMRGARQRWIDPIGSAKGCVEGTVAIARVIRASAPIPNYGAQNAASIVYCKRSPRRMVRAG
jgi:hypothetical protein